MTLDHVIFSIIGEKIDLTRNCVRLTKIEINYLQKNCIGLSLYIIYYNHIIFTEKLKKMYTLLNSY